MNCKNCNAEVNLNYCASCGHPVKLKRISGHYIIHEIEHVLHFERGILYTIRELLLRPGASIRNFINEDRGRLVKPIIFIILTSLAYTLADHYFHIEEKYAKPANAVIGATALIFKWITDHYGYGNIIMGAFIALWLKLFFRKSGYNFFEILILLCFVMGMGMLILAVFVIIQGLTHTDLMLASGLVTFAYCSWAIGQFFDSKKATSYVKAFAAYVIGAISFWLAAYLLGTLIDLFIKH